MGTLAMACLLLFGGAWALVSVALGLKTGRILNFFGRRSNEISFASSPVRFVASILGWTLFGIFFSFAGALVANSVPRLLLAILPSFVGPSTAFYLLITRRQHTLTLTTEALVERVVTANENEARAFVDMFEDGPVKRLLAPAAAAPREIDDYRGGPNRAEVLTQLDTVARAERARLTRRALPAVAVFFAPLVFSVAGLRDPHSWIAVAVCAAIAAIDVLIWRAQTRAVSRVARALRERFT